MQKMCIDVLSHLKKGRRSDQQVFRAVTVAHEKENTTIRGLYRVICG
jgi:hypothetical protein